MFWSPVNDADPAHAWLRTTLADVARGVLARHSAPSSVAAAA